MDSLLKVIAKREYQNKYNQSDKIKEYQKKYNQSDKRKESQKKYRQSDKIKEYQKKYYQANKEALNKYKKKYRALKKGKPLNKMSLKFLLN